MVSKWVITPIHPIYKEVTPRKNNISQNPRISKKPLHVSEPCFHDILLMEEILHRRGHIGQYGYDFYPRTPCSMLCSQALCAGAGFQSFNFFAFMTNFSYQC